MNDSDARDLRDVVVGRSWQQAMQVLTTPWFGENIWFLTPQGFRYYLPGYLTMLLDWDGDSNIGHTLIALLTWPDHQQDIPTFLERVAGLTPEECLVIKKFLLYMKNTYPGPLEASGIEQSIARFWDDDRVHKHLDTRGKDPL